MLATFNLNETKSQSAACMRNGDLSTYGRVKLSREFDIALVVSVPWFSKASQLEVALYYGGA